MATKTQYTAGLGRAEGLTLKPHQEEATEFLLRRSAPGQGTLLPLPARMGKTVAAVEAAYRAGKECILVVSPLTLIDGWEEEIHNWWSGEAIAVRKCHGVFPDRIDGWTFTNYETIKKFTEKISAQRFQTLWAGNYDLIILDESVKIKTPTALLTKAIYALIDSNPQATIWMLSANPSPKDLSDLWTQLYLCDEERAGRSFWRFAGKYCNVEATMWGDKIVGNKPGSEASIKEDFKHCFWSPTNLPELTPLRRTIREAYLSGEQLRIYLEMEAQFRAMLDQMSGNEILAPNVMVQAIRLLQIASNPSLVGGPSDGAKWRAATNAILSGELPKPVILWTSFKETVRQLVGHYEQMGLRIGHLTGDTAKNKRTATRHAFQNGEIDVLLAHPGVGRFGLNLSAANSVIWLEKTWDADGYYQASYRPRHLHKDTTVEVLELLAVNGNGGPTIDHAIHNVLQNRVESSSRLTAGDLRGAWHR